MHEPNLDIQSLHMQNNAYRDIITDLKEQINKYDRMINVNEMLIGRQLNDMEKTCLSPILDYSDVDTGCELCLGECKECVDSVTDSKPINDLAQEGQ